MTHTGSLVCALIRSNIDYCISLLYRIPNSEIAKIQRLLNIAAGLVCNATRFTHITPTMRYLHRFAIRPYTSFNALFLTFKVLHRLVPQHLKSSISIKTSYYNLRDSNTLLLAMSLVKSKLTLPDRAFAITAFYLRLMEYFIQITFCVAVRFSAKMSPQDLGTKVLHFN